MKLTGLIPATVTPFDREGAINDVDLSRHIERCAGVKGVYGVAVNGHAGEILALRPSERTHVVKMAAEAIPPGKKVISGIDGRTIEDLVNDGKSAKDNGADALLVLPPFDVRPYRNLASEESIVKTYFEKISDQVDLPMIVFLYPDKDGCTYPDNVLMKLTEIPNVVGIKAGAGNVTRYSGIWESLSKHTSVLAANDSPELFGMLLRGAHGALIGISVIGTEVWSELITSVMNGNLQNANKLFNEFSIPLAKTIFENQNPVTKISPFASTKEALFQLGELSSPTVRFPSVPPDEQKRAEISKVLHKIGLRRKKVLENDGVPR